MISEGKQGNKEYGVYENSLIIYIMTSTQLFEVFEVFENSFINIYNGNRRSLLKKEGFAKTIHNIYNS